MGTSGRTEFRSFRSGPWVRSSRADAEGPARNAFDVLPTRVLDATCVAGGTGEYETARSQIAIQLRLDRVQNHRDVLILVDEDRGICRRECRGTGGHGIARLRIVEVATPELEDG